MSLTLHEAGNALTAALLGKLLTYWGRGIYFSEPVQEPHSPIALAALRSALCKPYLCESNWKVLRIPLTLTIGGISRNIALEVDGFGPSFKPVPLRGGDRAQLFIYLLEGEPFSIRRYDWEGRLAGEVTLTEEIHLVQFPGTVLEFVRGLHQTETLPGHAFVVRNDHEGARSVVSRFTPHDRDEPLRLNVVRERLAGLPNYQHASRLLRDTHLLAYVETLRRCPRVSGEELSESASEVWGRVLFDELQLDWTPEADFAEMFAAEVFAHVCERRGIDPDSDDARELAVRTEEFDRLVEELTTLLDNVHTYDVQGLEMAYEANGSLPIVTWFAGGRRMRHLGYIAGDFRTSLADAIRPYLDASMIVGPLLQEKELPRSSSRHLTPWQRLVRYLRDTFGQ